MNLEKLGLLLFLRARSDFDQVALHLKQAVRELVLAGLTSTKALHEATQESNVLAPYEKAQKILQQCEALQKEAWQWCSEQSQTQSSAKKNLLRQIVSEILAGIAEEKAQILAESDGRKDPKIEVFEAITHVLTRRFLDKNDATSNEEVASKNASLDLSKTKPRANKRL